MNENQGTSSLKYKDLTKSVRQRGRISIICRCPSIVLGNASGVQYYPHSGFLISQMSQSSRWCFTLNNPDLCEVADFQLICDDPVRVVYAIFGDEVGEEGTFHVQGFVVFKGKHRLSGVKKFLERAHWEPARGSSSQAADYCKKDGKFVEFGECPRDTRFSSEGVSLQNIETWDAARRAAAEGRFDDIPSHLYVRFKGNFHSIFDDACVAKDCVSVLDHIWIHGCTGVGKSRYVWKNFPGAYRKPLNKWWDHYSKEEVVVLEDVDPTHEKWLGHLLKVWSDHYPFIAERKGGSRQIRPEKIIVTSNYSIADVFKDNGIYLPLQRRFKEYTVVNAVLLP